ncbi:oligopeptide/dipeptide ABC transporter ATP-binding protein [Sedimentibacter sp.]|uniref:ABC transporter ATP-binding protein n=1 Tax=Sedimentibacter sp. TaxID=1960295 RepID=UPI0028A0DCFB|nr:oligopeptide/dipeptide ABC transporter ATP-binding protein [Sedimentibacter sp.]
MSDTILEVKDLKKYFKTKRGMLHAVDGINFSLERGKTLGLVGESGCGKSTVGRTILRLIEPTAGEIIFEGKDIKKLNQTKLRHIRKDMQLIFQDPYSSLDPRKTVSQIISEPIIASRILKSSTDIHNRVAELMSTVGLAARLFNTYPHELDGGRRQRIGIARALAMEPKFIVCDEPVSALDVSIQAQILNLLKELQSEFNLSYIFITHDLSVVNHFSDEIAVMYLGKIVEKAPAEQLFENPLHPYTKALLSAIPIPELGVKKERILIKGEITSPINPPDECRFKKRCTYAYDKCDKLPELVEMEPNHFVSCHLVHEK